MHEIILKTAPEFEAYAEEIMERASNSLTGISHIKTVKTQRENVGLLRNTGWVCSVNEIGVPIAGEFLYEHNGLSCDEASRVDLKYGTLGYIFIAVAPETVATFLVATKKAEGCSIEIISTDVRYTDDENTATVLIGAVENDEYKGFVAKEYIIMCGKIDSLDWENGYEMEEA